MNVEFVPNTPDDEIDSITLNDLLYTNLNHSLIEESSTNEIIQNKKTEEIRDENTKNTLIEPVIKKKNQFKDANSIIPLADNVINLVEKIGGKFKVKGTRYYKYTKKIPRYIH